MKFGPVADCRARSAASPRIASVRAGDVIVEEGRDHLRRGSPRGSRLPASPRSSSRSARGRRYRRERGRPSAWPGAGRARHRQPRRPSPAGSISSPPRPACCKRRRCGARRLQHRSTRRSPSRRCLRSRRWSPARLVATVKIIPYAVAGRQVEDALARHRRGSSRSRSATTG